ncbi:Ctf8-domain-containing protein [Parachaetomium inaequale]|uniref:Ctf8-domain-containing protein n=1 Tax=Parachaetomium inaequale TaxID=2588326 RepID=A0AAN6PAS8_9PEZI|nr:Ctf8-domain-containing protein [Parachaetomium inaequale]
MSTSSSSPQTTPLHPRPRPPHKTTPNNNNPLPTLLQTPSGLALLELQGTINLPPFPPDNTSPTAAASLPAIPIGRLHFPDYHPDPSSSSDGTDTAWVKRVWMYVGEHQRLHGEVRKLPRAVAVLRRRAAQENAGEGGTEELEVVEVVKYKVVFSSRPEPVGSGVGS